MMNLEDIILQKYITSYKIAPLHFKDKITNAICKEYVRQWSTHLVYYMKLKKTMQSEDLLKIGFPQEIIETADLLGE